jgi:site-specific recombinase XerD
MLIVMRIDEQVWGSGSIHTKKHPVTGKVIQYRARIPVKTPDGDFLYKEDGSKYAPVEGTHKSSHQIAYRRAEARLHRIYVEHGIPVPEIPALQTRSQAQTAGVKNSTKDKSFWSVEKYAKHWRALHLDDTRHSKNTQARYRRDFDNHLIPTLGERVMGEITIDDIDDLVEVMKTKGNTLTGRPVNSNTRAKIMKSIRRMFDTAVDEDRILKNNPVLKRHIPSEIAPQYKGKLAHPELQAHVLQIVREAKLKEDAREFLMLMLMFYGVRQAERIGLSWPQIVDLSEPTAAHLTVNQQLLNVDGQGATIVPHTKTRRTRSFYLGETLRQALVTYRHEQDSWKRSDEWSPRAGMEDLVLTSETGSPVYQTKANEIWHELSGKYFSAKKLRSWGIDALNEHGMRHLAASYLVASGTDMTTAGKILGHTNAKMTEYYVETDKEFTKEAVHDHDAFLGAGLTQHSLDGFFDDDDEGLSS